MYIHITSFVIYFFILIVAADTGRLSLRAPTPALRKLIFTFCAAVLCMSATFVTIQSAYVLAGEVFDPDDPLDMLWLLYDWTNAIAYLSSIAAARVLVQWQWSPCADAPRNCPRLHESRSNDFHCVSQGGC